MVVSELVKLQGGDAENLAIWEKCVEVSNIGLKKIYQLLGIEFDLWLGESFYNEALAPVVNELIESGGASEEDGAIKIFSDGTRDPKEDPFMKFEDDEWIAWPFVIRKADGGFLYTTTDLATLDYRVDELGADVVWYVVGAPQENHFDKLFEIAEPKRTGSSVAGAAISTPVASARSCRIMSLRPAPPLITIRLTRAPAAVCASTI